MRRLHHPRLVAPLAVALLAGPACADRMCVESLPPLPLALSNNAVTSVDNGDGTFTLYSFMGITDPTNFTTITAASFRLDWPGGKWASHNKRQPPCAQKSTGALWCANGDHDNYYGCPNYNVAQGLNLTFFEIFLKKIHVLNFYFMLIFLSN